MGDCSEVLKTRYYGKRAKYQVGGRCSGSLEKSVSAFFFLSYGHAEINSNPCLMSHTRLFNSRMQRKSSNEGLGKEF